MMKKILKNLIIVLFLIPLIYLGIFFIQSYTMKKSFIKFYGLKNIKETEKPYNFQRCNFNIFDSEFAYLTGKNRALISFYKPKHLFSQSKEEWKNSRTGGTTIKNTTFDELVKMAKEDCSQFQEDFDAEDPKTQIDWGYREVEPPKTEKELEMEKKEEYYGTIKGMNYQFDNLFTDLQKTKFTEFYGDIHSMTNEEKYNLAKEIINNGGVDESLREHFYDEDGNPMLKKPE